MPCPGFCTTKSFYSSSFQPFKGHTIFIWKCRLGENTYTEKKKKEKIKEAKHSLFKMVILQNRPKLKLTSQSSRRKEELFPLKKYIIKK